jgi:hypothetical protein
MFNNAININKTNNNLPTNTTEHTRPWNMALETKVLTWDRNKYVEGLKRLMAFQP